MRTVVLIRREARLGLRKLHRASAGTNRTASSGVCVLDDCLVGSHEQRCCAALWKFARCRGVDEVFLVISVKEARRESLESLIKASWSF